MVSPLAVWGPKKLPVDLIAEFNGKINDAVRTLDNDGRLAKIGVAPVSETPARFADFAKSYRDRNAELLKAANFEAI